MRTTKLRLVLTAVLGLVVFTPQSVPAAPRQAPVRAAHTAAVFDVKDYGATGNGSSNDTPGINKAITAANSAGGGTVRFRSGTYRSSNTIHLKSDVTIQLDSGSTILGSGSNTYDPPEPNEWDTYQDYGHSHFHNAMIHGDRLTNVAFTGSGTIDGGDHLITGNPGRGQADKIISLTRCDGLTFNGITLKQGGHFAILINGCRNVTSDHLTIATSGDRDGWNVISAENVSITNANIAANDDALVFKSDYALGAKLSNGHVRVSDSKLSAKCCNALMFGSETCGDLTDYVFQRIAITGAQKSGLGMVSMDGARITDVHYKDITMSGTRSPIMQKVGTRKRCGNNPGVGSISGITYENIKGTGASPSFSPTLWGESGGGRISDVAFSHVDLTVPGGNGTMGTGVPSNNATDYNPRSIGTRPAYGWYLRNVSGVSFTDSSVRFAADDGRPAVIVNNGGDVSFDRFTAQRGGGSPHDVGFQTVTGYCLANSRNTSGGALRVSATGSTSPCGGAGSGTVSGLHVADTANSGDWSLQSGLRAGATQYGDRTITLASVPAALMGAQWIRSANDSKGATADPLVGFTLSDQATVSVAVDTRTGRLPWLDSSWTDSGTRLVNSESTPKNFQVFQKSFPAGPVRLGPNAGTGSMYTVVVN
ncbi:glycoside hydrolase family 28 protein [Wenjunlia tyrosinilytica]|uniref:Glycoside hydrolase n=1 Tax=Wenjunlia tyrosinilytica TaxID=1544741 RepID=A0A918DVX5_9ACTN|nr:glycosyl hydrolase family 28 protein [Wenjunlia tyrosinilytica]GGO84054.1 glycoside hydrolase [Wenjunlia tyrosinilytica]